MSVKYLLNLHDYQTIHRRLLDTNHTMLKAAIKQASETSSISDYTGLQTTHSDAVR